MTRTDRPVSRRDLEIARRAVVVAAVVRHTDSVVTPPHLHPGTDSGTPAPSAAEAPVVGSGTTGARPADDETVASVLQRLARARTTLVLAERSVVRQGATPSPDGSALIEAARVDLLWATASAILAPEQDRSRRRLHEARDHLADLLERSGFTSYAEFSAERPPAAVPDEPEVAVARAEFEEAASAWEAIQAQLLDPDVIDLTDPA